MDYSNPKIPEGINTGTSHPLKEFAWLVSGVVASVVVLVFLLILLSDFVVGYIPFSWEKKITASFFELQDDEKSKAGTTVTQFPIENYLQNLANQISTAQQVPTEMEISVHYIDDETVNAFATLGGHVFFYRGLLEKLPNENALAMVMAHEIAHIKHRHPIHSMGRGVIVSLALTLLGGSGDLMQSFVQGAGYLTVLKFGRDMETEADEAAMQTLLVMYGHLAGAQDLFTILQKASEGKEPFAFFSTHPLTQDRMDRIQVRQSSNQPTIPNRVKPLPEYFATWLSSTGSPL